MKHLVLTLITLGLASTTVWAQGGDDSGSQTSPGCTNDCSCLKMYINGIENNFKDLYRTGSKKTGITLSYETKYEIYDMEGVFNVNKYAKDGSFKQFSNNNTDTENYLSKVWFSKKYYSAGDYDFDALKEKINRCLGPSWAMEHNEYPMESAKEVVFTNGAKKVTLSVRMDFSHEVEIMIEHNN